MVLDDKACPAQLQSVYPHQGTKFTLQMKRGGLVRVYDACLMTGTQYKSLLLSDKTSVQELIQLVLHCNHSQETPAKFSMFEVCPAQNLNRKLHPEEIPLRIQQEWPTQDLVFFQLRRNSSTTDEQLPVRRRTVSLLLLFSLVVQQTKAASVCQVRFTPTSMHLSLYLMHANRIQ